MLSQRHMVSTSDSYFIWILMDPANFRGYLPLVSFFIDLKAHHFTISKYLLPAHRLPAAIYLFELMKNGGRSNFTAPNYLQ